MDKVIRTAVKAYNDSAPRPPPRRPPDWIITRGDKRYGVSAGWLHLGVVSIPSVSKVIAPLNIQERDQAATARYDDIVRHARRAENAVMFKQAVRATRLRVEQQRVALDEIKRSANPADDR